jgi:hypothetical protein
MVVSGRHDCRGHGHGSRALCCETARARMPSICGISIWATVGSECRLTSNCITGFPSTVGYNSSTHRLRKVCVSGIGRHGHCAFVCWPVRYDSSMRSSSCQIGVHMRLLAESMSRGDGIVAASAGRLVGRPCVCCQRLRPEGIAIERRSRTRSARAIRAVREGTLILPWRWWSTDIKSLWLSVRHSIGADRLR